MSEGIVSVIYVSYYSDMQYNLNGFYNRKGVHLLRGTDCI